MDSSYHTAASRSLGLYTHTPVNGPLSGTTRVSQYQKGKANLDFVGARDSEWQWNQLGHMQVCTLLQTDNHASTPPLSFFTGWMPFPPPNQQCHRTEGLQRGQIQTRPMLLLMLTKPHHNGFGSSRVVSVLDSDAVGPGFKSQPRRCRVTVLGKLFTHQSCLCSPRSETGSSPLKGYGGNCRPGGK